MTDSDRVQKIFAEALDRPASSRAAFLDEACADDVHLREEVRGLLGALERAGHFMTNPSQDAAGVATHLEATAASEISEKEGTIIGRYQLRQRIGEGGFGVVYMAEQEKPLPGRNPLHNSSRESAEESRLNSL